jgi:phage regulator Rha-like protein
MAVADISLLEGSWCWRGPMFCYLLSDAHCQLTANNAAIASEYENYSLLASYTVSILTRQSAMAKKPLSRAVQEPISLKDVSSRILIVRGQRVMLDSDIAELYGVATKALNQAVKRNLERFPEDFMLHLTVEETRALRSQSVTSNTGRGGRRYPPYAFTEHGAVMLASLLNSPIAIEASIRVVRAFVELRSILAANKDLARRLEALEKKTDHQFAVVFEVIEQLLADEEKPKRQIGFGAKSED